MNYAFVFWLHEIFKNLVSSAFNSRLISLLACKQSHYNSLLQHMLPNTQICFWH